MKEDEKEKEHPKPKAKEKAKEVEQTKKKKATKPKVLEPPPESDSEGDEDKATQVQPKKPQLKSVVKAASSKQPPKFISSNANAKLKSKATPSTAKATKTKQIAKLPSPAPSESDHDAENDDEEEEQEGEVSAGEEDEADVHLHGFSTDEGDSSDEDDDAGEEKPGLSVFEISKLPTVVKDDETVKRRLEKAKRQPVQDRGVVYIGRLPHGFYEEQLKGYFSQFGDITRLRISRNKKTGKCKHYGFIEFNSSSVAQIVAETMDNYLLTGHILRCKLIPKDEVHPELWIGANRKWRNVPRDRIVRVQHNKKRTAEQLARANKRLIKRQNERKRKLAEMGIEYAFDAISYKKPKANEKV
ncbi:hypothetical protein AN958_07147 [Leucoagaricus sp. SymC.cos]|nr:hypothetical protein AN958_07147 [Leucoagaricus sp. SymC.cos]